MGRGYKNNAYLVGRKILGVKSSEYMENDISEDTLGKNNNGYTTTKKIVYEEVYVQFQSMFPLFTLSTFEPNISNK